MYHVDNWGAVTNQAARDIHIASQTNNYHPTRPETPPTPSCTLRFDRDLDFVNRGTLLDQIRELSARASRIALVGLGGVGKSQLAIEHAYRTHDRSPETWVFWVYASNAARFEQSYRDIADRVKIAGRQDPKANIFQLVYDWLRDGKSQWLLMLDNVDDAHFLLESQGTDLDSARRPLRDYLPRCEHSSILVTTRNKEAALKLVQQRDIIAVEPMDKAQAQALFEKKLGAQGDSGEVGELAAALEYMPLAIVQAAAYITQRAPRCSVKQYLEEFRKSERKRTSLLYRDGGELRRDSEAKNSIIVTWEISFQHIHDTRPSAADLLSLMSFFDRQGIPEELLRSRTKQRDGEGGQEERGNNECDSNGDDDEEDDTSQSSASDEGFEDDVVALRNFCFISVETNGTSFEMHALVQLATRKWLEANGKLERWKQQSIDNLCAAFPTGHHENWARCQALFAHAKAAAEQKPEGEPSLAQWATLLYRAAWFALEIGNIADAEKLAVKSMKARKTALGPEHEDTLWSMAMVGEAYRLGGRWKEAEKLFVQVMETSKTKLGHDHPDTLTSMANLASTYRNQGRWEEAEKLDVQVMETRKTKLGYDHPDTLANMHNLAFTWKGQGRDAEAIDLMRNCVELRRRILGACHLHSISSSSVLSEWEAETQQIIGSS